MAKRLFFGLELPSAYRAELAALDPHIKNARWARTGQIHLTLIFLGDVTPEDEVALLETINSVRVPPFFLPLRGFGRFGGKRPSLLWVGVGSGHPHLFALHKHLQDAVLRARLKPDLRAFQPISQLPVFGAFPAKCCDPLSENTRSASSGCGKCATSFCTPAIKATVAPPTRSKGTGAWGERVGECQRT